MPRTRNWLLAVAAVGVLGGAGLVGVGRTHGSDDAAPAAAASPAGGFPAGRSPAPADRGEPPGEERRRRVRALDAALREYAATVPEFSVAVLDARTGERYAYRGSERYETASVVKVQVLACLLLRAQDENRELTGEELAQARRMIRLSDNDATTALFRQLGRESGLTRCHERLGLTATRVDKAWGLTRTTVDDQVTLLGKLVDARGPLNADSRKLAFTLMSTVDEDQVWGVSAVAGRGETTTVKNGWLPRSTEEHRWIINSVGRVTGDDVDVSIAVLSHGHGDMPGGIEVVEKAAKLTRRHLRY